MNIRLGGAVLGAILLIVGAAAQAKEYEVTLRTDIQFAEHDGAKLLGDLYLPKSLDKAPVLVAVHGGGFQAGSRKFYANWGTYLARNGYAAFSIDYRLLPNAKTYPGAIYDTKSAVQFVRARASELGVDPERIGLVGDSAGAYLGAMVALAGEEPQFSSEYRSQPNASVSARLKVMVGFYGPYDLLTQWERDAVVRPRENPGEKLLGAAPYTNRKVFFEASPISYATADKNSTRFLLLHGTNDDNVDPSQSIAFHKALTQAGISSRTVFIPGAGHYFITDPVDETSFNGFAGPRVLRFLAGGL